MIEKLTVENLTVNLPCGRDFLLTLATIRSVLSAFRLWPETTSNIGLSGTNYADDKMNSKESRYSKEGYLTNTQPCILQTEISCPKLVAISLFIGCQSL